MAGANMKALTLLAVLLCLEEAWAIKCYSCTNPNDNTCQRKTQCPADNKACFTQTLSYKKNGVQQTKTEKYCVPSCDNIPPMKSRETLLESRANSYCCKSDLCNRARAQGPGDTTMGLMFVASVLTTFLGASV